MVEAHDPPPPPPHHERRQRAVGWHSKDVVRAAALVLGMYLGIQLVWNASPLVLTAFLGVLFGLAVEAGVDKLERFRIPRGAGAGLIVVTFFALLVGIGAWITPTIREQSGELRAKIPEAVDRIEAWFGKRQRGFMAVFRGTHTGGTTQVADSTRAAPESTAAQKDTAPRALNDTVARTVAA